MTARPEPARLTLANCNESISSKSSGSAYAQSPILIVTPRV